jgi:hypothetical protein
MTEIHVYEKYFLMSYRGFIQIQFSQNMPLSREP